MVLNKDGNTTDNVSQENFTSKTVGDEAIIWGNWPYAYRLWSTYSWVMYRSANIRSFQQLLTYLLDPAVVDNVILSWVWHCHTVITVLQPPRIAITYLYDLWLTRASCLSSRSSACTAETDSYDSGTARLLLRVGHNSPPPVLSFLPSLLCHFPFLPYLPIIIYSLSLGPYPLNPVREYERAL